MNLLKEEIKHISDEELLKMFSKKKDYTEEAFALILSEMKERNLTEKDLLDKANINNKKVNIKIPTNKTGLILKVVGVLYIVFGIIINSIHISQPYFEGLRTIDFFYSVSLSFVTGFILIGLGEIIQLLSEKS
ncbi:hypothetical protein SYNTR_0697 [Candidatus Syntrophocurvum alkaliphilum]|uniref:Uncharacterized protein n=1 Tax=Candidatus Syntrophocurvum alkaliphilum TaxID=2293317 RepID=A0A6I6DFT4_9FIRM|nr:hypothetical protein [Candidatus Syntrophocurvum alkaliphilum]QGT99290.1 hypothetical protein SYNTR_0697 [Candidatus Syntrophocurvum alkaliphilum]